MSADHAQAGRDLYVASVLHVHPAAETALLSVHQLPPTPVAFTGREDELAELEKQLTSAQSAGATISATQPHAGLQGMGGVGKTALAVVLAHRLKDRYPDAQLVLNLRGTDPGQRPPVPPAEAMQSVIHAFHPEARLPESAEELAPMYRSVLTDAGRVLLLLDNAASADQVHPLLPPANCLLLVTSRAQFTLPGLATRNLDCLPPAKAQEFLLKLAKRINNGHAAVAADLCAHLPLALEVFAGTVNDKRLYPVPELLERLRARQEKLAPVEAAFQVSYELLAEDQRRRWTLLAVFPASFDLRAAAAVWGEEEATAREAMQALFNANVVEWNEANGRFRLHDLARQFCEGELAAAERSGAQRRHAEHYRSVGAEADALYLQGGQQVVRGLELFDRERVHLEAAFEWLQAQKDKESAQLLVALVNAVACVSNLRFHPRQTICWLEAERDAARLAEDREAEGAALGNLGNAYIDLGDARKAIECYEQHRDIAREIGDRRGEGNALGNLGLAYAALGDARHAIEYQEQALVIDRALGDRRGEGTALGNLGSAYAALGDTRHAIEFHKLRLVIAHEIGDRRGEGNALGNLGNAYAALGDTRQAIEYHEQYLVIAREIGDRRGEGNALWNSAIALDQLGERSQAIARAEAALHIYETIEDPNAAEVRAWLTEWHKANA